MKDVTLIIAEIETQDGETYAVTKIFRYDVEDHERPEELLSSIAVEGGPMIAEKTIK